MLSGTLLHPRPAMCPVRQFKFTDSDIIIAYLIRIKLSIADFGTK